MKDALARLALNESLTDHEQVLSDTVMNLCVDSPTIDGLVVLVAAINRKASLRGLKLGISLRRPKKRLPPVMSYAEIDKLMPQLPVGKKLTGRSFIRPETAPFLVRPLMKIGPIEAELREKREHLSARAYRVYAAARLSLKLHGLVDPDDIDTMSEAIEAAGALGL